MEKKILHIFLSSDEADTHDLRMELGNYIRALNDRFENLYFRLWMNGKSEDSDALIGESDYVYTLFFRRADEDGAVKDFRTAYDRFKENGAPKIMTFFKNIPEGEAADESVKAFMTELGDRLEHYYTKFENIDTVLLKILLELAGQPENPIGRVEFQDSCLLINDEEFGSIHLENLPFYGNHEAIQGLKKELEELETEIAAARKATRENPDDDDLMDRYADLRNQRARMQKQLHEYEKQLLEVSMSMAKRATDGKPITHRTRLAMEYFDEGKVTQALAVLDPEEFKLDLKRLDELNDVLTDRYEALVQELKTKIEILKSQGVSSERAKEIKELYETARQIVLEKNLDLGDVVDYLRFLEDENDYSRAIEVGEQLYHSYKSNNNCNNYEWAWFCCVMANIYSKRDRVYDAEQYYLEAMHEFGKYDNFLELLQSIEYCDGYFKTVSNLANLYVSINHFEMAEKLIKFAIEYYRWLASAVREYSDSKGNIRVLDYCNLLDYCNSLLASSCYNLGNLLLDNKSYTESEALLIESVNIRCALAEHNPNEYEIDMARSCNSLANLLQKKEQFVEAKNLYLKAVGVLNKYVEKNHGRYGSEVAGIYMNLANLYTMDFCFSEAQKMYLEALKIFDELSICAPYIYDDNVAMACNNLARLYWKMNLVSKADTMFQRALKIRRSLADRNNSTYETGLAKTYDDLGTFYCECNRTSDAEELLGEALRIYQNKGDCEQIAVTSSHLADLYRKTHRNGKARELYLNAEKMMRTLAQQYPDVYKSELAAICHNHANMMQSMRNLKEAVTLYEEALCIYRTLVNCNPDTYSFDYLVTCLNLASVYTDQYLVKEAKELYDIVYDVVFDLSDDLPEVYDPLVAMYCFQYAELCEISTQFGTAREYFEEALERALPYKDTNFYCRQIVDALSK